jgi:dihydroorotate dehydrogenase (NAD+) catalytic subunit
LVGASAVQVGTTLFVYPHAPVQIVEDLKKYLKEKKIASVSELVGKVQKY